MQKEALGAGSADRRVWRLVSDEGPYLNGYDEAPFPLAHMTTGMVASYMSETIALAKARGIPPQALRGLRLTLHSHYGMQGSALRGTMTGSAYPPELEVEAGRELTAELDAETLRGLVSEAVAASPVNALLGPVHESLFTLTVGGGPVVPERVRALAAGPPADPGERMADAKPDDDGSPPQPLVELVTAAERVSGTGGQRSSFAEKQSRRLHVLGACTLRADGVKTIDLSLASPIGSTFRLLSDKRPGFGGGGRAPDAATYLAAGIAFCFMTQLGRYATITRKSLDAYRLVQDLHLPAGGASAGADGDRPPAADPVESHVYLDTGEGEEFARQALDMSEQTCFLHALCRTPLQTRFVSAQQ